MPFLKINVKEIPLSLTKNPQEPFLKKKKNRNEVNVVS